MVVMAQGLERGMTMPMVVGSNPFENMWHHFYFSPLIPTRATFGDKSGCPRFDMGMPELHIAKRFSLDHYLMIWVLKIKPLAKRSSCDASGNE